MAPQIRRSNNLKDEHIQQKHRSYHNKQISLTAKATLFMKLPQSLTDKTASSAESSQQMMSTGSDRYGEGRICRRSETSRGTRAANPRSLSLSNTDSGDRRTLNVLMKLESIGERETESEPESTTHGGEDGTQSSWKSIDRVNERAKKECESIIESVSKRIIAGGNRKIRSVGDSRIGSGERRTRSVSRYLHSVQRTESDRVESTSK